MTDEKAKQAIQLRKAAVKAKRQLTRKKRQENIEKAPNPPLLLSLNELQKKTNSMFKSRQQICCEL